MYAGVLHACVSVHHIRAVTVEDKRDIGQPGTGTAAGFEVSCGCLRSNPGHLEEQPVIFPADQPPVLFLREDLSLASEAGQQTPGICLSLAHLRITRVTSTDVFLETEGPPVAEEEGTGGEFLVEIPGLGQGEEMISTAQVDGSRTTLRGNMKLNQC